MTDDLVQHLRKGEVSIKMPDGSVQLVNHVAADRIEALKAALETYAEDCDMTCCETIHRQGNGCGYTARAALGEKADG